MEDALSPISFGRIRGDNGRGRHKSGLPPPRPDRSPSEFPSQTSRREEPPAHPLRTRFMAYDLRFALRMILAHRWFSLAVVITLALGIGLNTMVFTIVNAALFKPVPVPGGARLVSVATHMPDGRDTRMSWPDLLDYRAQAHSFEALEGASNQEGVLGEPGIPPQSYHLDRATSGIFSMLHIHPVLGRDFLPSDA